MITDRQGGRTMKGATDPRHVWRFLLVVPALVLLGLSLGVGLNSGGTAHAYSPDSGGPSAFGQIGASAPLTTPTLPPTSTPTYTASPTFTGTPTVVCTPGGPYVYATVTGPPYVVATTDMGNHCDNCTTPILLPFPVRFFQFQTFNSAIVGSNGILAFTANGNPAANTCLPDLTSNNAIFALWDDLRTDGAGGSAGIYTLQSGSAPPRSFVIEWRACLNTGVPCTSVDASFE